MATQFVDGDTTPPGRASKPSQRRYLFGPWQDFLTFGGGSLVIIPFLLLIPADKHVATVAFATMVASHFVNNPHFAHSYQLFYRGFAAKALGGTIGREMQLRYLFAGLAVPAVLLAYLAVGVALGRMKMLGYAANAMFLFVGWHYVKQGYGLMMVDCALKKQFFGDRDKKILVANGYAVWIAAWCYLNWVVAQKDMLGIEYLTFGMPDWVVVLTGTIAAATSAMALAALFTAYRKLGSLPWNGVLAYGVSLYLWIGFVRFDPIWLLLVPPLHSLQYLAVVWRFETNYASGKYSASPELGKNVGQHLSKFVIAGIVLGFIGFWGAPFAMTMVAEAPQQALGAGVFMFSAWVFINVHHYFMDNVMWRRNNPDTKRYLFG